VFGSLCLLSSKEGSGTCVMVKISQKIHWEIPPTYQKKYTYPPVYRKMNHMVGIIRQELFPATGDP